MKSDDHRHLLSSWRCRDGQQGSPVMSTDCNIEHFLSIKLEKNMTHFSEALWSFRDGLEIFVLVAKATQEIASFATIGYSGLIFPTTRWPGVSVRFLCPCLLYLQAQFLGPYSQRVLDKTSGFCCLSSVKKQSKTVTVYSIQNMFF